MEEILVLETEKIDKRESLLTDLYKRTFPIVAQYIHKMGGSFEEAKDVFHDALLLYYEKHVNQEHDVIMNSKAYILGVSRNIWINRFRDKSKFLPMENFPNSTEEIDSKEPGVISDKLMKFLSTTGKRCMDLLSAFYFDKNSLDVIAEKFGFSGIRSATAQKYKCLEKVRNTVKEKCLTYEDFTE